MTTRQQILRSSVTGASPAAGTRQPGELWATFPDLQLGIIDTSKNARALIAVRYFSTTANYAIGDYVVQAGQLYRARTAVTAGAFSAGQWDALATVASIAGYLPLSGGTMTGAIKSISGDSIDGAAGTARYMIGSTAGSSRWVLTLGDSTSESGSNAGSNFQLNNYSDGGTFLGTPLSITRSSGLINANAVGANPYNGPFTVGSTALFLNRAVGANSNAIYGTTNGSLRWGVYLGGSPTESGGNVGSDFSLVSFDDSGVGIGTPLKISRANGTATFTAGIGVNSTLPYFGMYNAAGTRQGAIYWSSAANQIVATNDTGNGQWLLNSDMSFQINSAVGLKASGTTWANPSDARIKTVQGDYAPGLDEVLKLNPKVFTYKGNDTPTSAPDPVVFGEQAEKPQARIAAVPYPASHHYQAALDQTPVAGFIAQDVEAVFPEMVTQGTGFIDGEEVADFRTLDTSNLILALVNAVKTLTARLEALEGGAK